MIIVESGLTNAELNDVLRFNKENGVGHRGRSIPIDRLATAIATTAVIERVAKVSFNQATNAVAAVTQCSPRHFALRCL